MGKYTINNIEVPGVTTVLGTLDKSGALMGWATGCMEKWCVNKIDEYVKEFGYGTRIPTDTVKDIIKDARFSYKEVSKEAMSIGSQVHGIIERHIKTNLAGKTPVYFELNKDPVVNSDEVYNGYNAFLEWEKANVVKYLESEQPIFHAGELYGGTLDLIAELKDGVYCIDFKVSKAHYPETALQLSSYKYGRESITEPTVLNVKNRDGQESVHNLNPIKIDGLLCLRLDKSTGLPDPKNYTKDYDRKLASFLSLLDHWYKDKNRQLKGNDRALKLKEKFKKN